MSLYNTPAPAPAMAQGQMGMGAYGMGMPGMPAMQQQANPYAVWT